MSGWHVIIDQDGGVRQVASLDGEDVDGRQVHEVDRPGDLALEVFDGGHGWTDNMPAVRAALSDEIDRQREARQQEKLTGGTAKALVYAQKAREVDLYRSTPGVTRTAAEIERDFPAAAAEMAVTGDSLETVITRIGAAAAAANAAVFRLDALATCAKEGVRNAATAAAARAAAVVDWPA